MIILEAWREHCEKYGTVHQSHRDHRGIDHRWFGGWPHNQCTARLVLAPCKYVAAYTSVGVGKIMVTKMTKMAMALLALHSAGFLPVPYKKNRISFLLYARRSVTDWQLRVSTPRKRGVGHCQQSRRNRNAGMSYLFTETWGISPCLYSAIVFSRYPT